MPPLAEIVERVDTRLRTIATIVASAVESSGSTALDETAATTELLGAAQRWLERLADHNRHFRRASVPHGAPLTSRLQNAFDNAAGALRGMDEKQFRRRSTLHSFDKSHAEGVFACVLALGDILLRAAEKASALDPDVFAKIYERVLAHPPMPELHFVDESTTPR